MIYNSKETNMQYFWDSTEMKREEIIPMINRLVQNMRSKDLTNWRSYILKGDRIKRLDKYLTLPVALCDFSDPAIQSEISKHYSDSFINDRLMLTNNFLVTQHCYDSFINNLRHNGPWWIRSLNVSNEERLRCWMYYMGIQGNAIDRAFTWIDTREGHSYWSELNDSLYDVLEDQLTQWRLTNHLSNTYLPLNVPY
jgi:hypothetical protein